MTLFMREPPCGGFPWGTRQNWTLTFIVVIITIIFMINIADKSKCCGCNACVQKCPKQCISMHEDEEGFLYPKVGLDLCIDCHLCEKVCPVLNQGEPHQPLKAYAAITTNEELRMKSSSGGIFTLLAEAVICEGGVVFGALFDENWEVKHDYTESLEGLVAFRCSKYVQSRIGNSYKKTQDFLKNNRTVLFSGTSCQIAGLKLFLNKEYDNLITVDIVCHGVPSPLIWREYLATIANKPDIKSITHKEKNSGWRRYSISVEMNDKIVTERAANNKYMLAFAQNLTLRQSCFECSAKAGKCCSDITLGDFWGIEHVKPTLDDDRGTSFVCVNTERGNALLSKTNAIYSEVDYDASIPYNSCIVKSTNKPQGRELFWKKYSEQGIVVLFHLKPKKNNIIKRIIKRIIKSAR